jgi:hypothetical protein
VSSTTDAGPPDDPTAVPPGRAAATAPPSGDPADGVSGGGAPAGGVPIAAAPGEVLLNDGHQPATVRRADRRWWWGPAVVAAMVLGGAPLGVAWSMLAPWIPVVKTEQGAAVRGADPEYFVAADGWFAFLGLGFGIVAGVVVWALLPRLRGPLGLLAVTFGGLGAAAVAWALGRQIGLAGYRRALESAEFGAQLSRPPDLQAGAFDVWFGVLPALTGAFCAPAFGAALVYTMLAGWSRYPSLRPEPDPDGADADLQPPGSADADPSPGSAEVAPAVSADADPRLGGNRPPAAGGHPAPISGSAGPAVSSGSPAPPTPATGPAPPAPGAAATPPD